MPLSIMAQLTAPGSAALRYTAYPSAPGIKDPVFIFCNSSGAVTGNLNAVSPGGTGPFSFTWYIWSDATKSFSVLLKSESNLMSSSAGNLNEGGYRVNISDGAYSTSLTGWIFIDKPYSSASLKNRTCDYVALSGMAATDTFYYKDPSGGNPVKLPNRVKFLWSSIPVSSIPYPDFNINPQTFNPPLEDVTYQLQVSDSFGCISQASFQYQSIHVKADFTPDPVKGEAPLIVSFNNKSIRGATFKWEFGDDSPDSNLEVPENHTYLIPGSYSVKLTIESELHCIDSMRYDSIDVERSTLSIPNVFTPDDDGYNDRFKVESKSLRFISVEIFSQSGMKVYGFSGEGDKLKSWTGWDGKINNTSINASPGVYFYIIRALGWDNIRYDSKAYRGFLYLYR
jgi:gliding motility-associated-like protein